MVGVGCAECGFGGGSDSAGLVVRCEAFGRFVDGVLGSGDPEGIRRRPEAGVWSMVEYCAHVGEAVGWYVGRVECVLEEDLPQLAPFDFDAAAEDGQYSQRSIDRVVADVRAACGALAELVRSVSGEQLRRCGLGSDGSPRSVELLLARAEHELVHHELDVRRGLEILGEPPAGTMRW